MESLIADLREIAESIVDTSTQEGQTLLRAAVELEAQGLEIRALKLVEYGNALPAGVTTEAFAEASLLRAEAARLRA